MLQFHWIGSIFFKGFLFRIWEIKCLVEIQELLMNIATEEGR